MNTMLTTELHASGYMVGTDRQTLIKELIGREAAIGRVDKTGRPLTQDQRVAALVDEERTRIAAERAAKISRCPTEAGKAALRRAFAAVDGVAHVLAAPPPMALDPAGVVEINERARHALGTDARSIARQKLRTDDCRRTAARALATANASIEASRRHEGEMAAIRATQTIPKVDILDRRIKAREAWLEKVVQSLVPKLFALNIKPSPETGAIKISMVPLPGGKFAECHHKRDGIHFVNVDVDKHGEGVSGDLERIHSVAHEMTHAYAAGLKNCGPDGHGPAWLALVKPLGMQARGHDRPLRTQILFEQVLREVGAMPRAAAC